MPITVFGQNVPRKDARAVIGVPAAVSTAQVGQVTVSPIGVAAGYTENNGCDFGPDTTGTTTCGIQEAINSLLAYNGYDYGGSTPIASKTGVVQLAAGVFRTTRPIVIPAYGNITIQGAGRSQFSYTMPITPYEDRGGSQIVGNCISAQGIFQGVLQVPTSPLATATLTSAGGDASALVGAQTLTYSGTLPANGWFSMPVSTGTAIFAAGTGGGSLTSCKLMAIFGNDGTYKTSGTYVTGAPITKYSLAASGSASFGQFGGGGYCRTRFSMYDVDIRAIAPASAQFYNSATYGYFYPPVVELSGQHIGEVANVSVTEVDATSGISSRIGSCLFSYCGGANGDMKVYRNILVTGGHSGACFNGSHIHAEMITACAQNFTGQASRGIDIAGNYGQSFVNLQSHSALNGLGYCGYPYGELTTVIDGFHFENVSVASGHYIVQNGTTGNLKIRNPTWDSTTLDPVTDIRATMGNILVFTDDESNVNATTQQHVTAASYNFTPGAAGPGWWPTVGTTSPLIIPALPVDQTWNLTTANTITALAVNGNSLFPAAPVAGATVYVKAGNTLTITYSGAAPVFRVIPQ